jgi:hypothetical protein
MRADRFFIFSKQELVAITIIPSVAQVPRRRITAGAALPMVTTKEEFTQSRDRYLQWLTDQFGNPAPAHGRRMRDLPGFLSLEYSWVSDSSEILLTTATVDSIPFAGTLQIDLHPALNNKQRQEEIERAFREFGKSYGSPGF